jgi:membrane-associated phospholipid phosphatase
MYGMCVAIATVYGRYHYAVDVLAGAALSFIGPVLAYLLAYRKSRGA